MAELMKDWAGLFVVYESSRRLLVCEVFAMGKGEDIRRQIGTTEQWSERSS